MKNLFSVAALALVATLATPQASQAAVFAAHLEMVDNGNGTYNLNYRLNEDANQGVTVRVKDSSDTTVRTFTLGNQSEGPQSVVWDGKDDSAANVPTGNYTWEVEASTNQTGSGDAYVKTRDGSLYQHKFYTPYGVETVNNTASPHFGKIYVADRGGPIAGTSPQRTTSGGIYVLSADMEDIDNRGELPYSGGFANAGLYTWSASGPFRLFVTDDDKLFITELSDSNSGIYVMDLDNPTANFDPLFDTSITRETDGRRLGLHGSTSSVYVEGDAANRVITTMDEDLMDGGTFDTNPQAGSIWQYELGSALSGYSTPPTVVYDDSQFSNAVVNFTTKHKKDVLPGRSGWWVSQYRATENATNPCLFHFDGTTVDWKSSVDLPGTVDILNNAAMDLSEDGKLIAVGGRAYFKVLNVEDLGNVNVIYEDTPSGNTKRDAAFDAAGNILLSSSSAETVIYYSKTGENTFTTPNPTGAEISVVNAGVDSWGLY